MEKNMTLEQIEELVNAYFECRLSRTEEAALRRLLAVGIDHCVHSR